MKNPIFTIVLLLFSGQLLVSFGGDSDMDAIMVANASTAASNVPHYRYVFKTVGSQIKVYMFAQSTANPPIFYTSESAV